MTIHEHFLTRAAEHPDRIAIVASHLVSITYGELAAKSEALAAAWARKGIVAGDRILVAVWPGIDLYASLAAVWRLGAVAVLPEASMGLAGFRHAASVAQPRAILAGPAIRLLSWLLPETLRIPIGLSPTAGKPTDTCPIHPSTPDDAALISFTSGTTGKPKGIIRSHGLLLAQHEALAPILAPGEKPEVDLVAFPAFVLTCLGHGTTAVIPDWDVRRHDLATAHDISLQARWSGATRLLVPPVIVARLAEDGLLAPVHRVLTGGGPVYPDVARAFLKKNRGVGLTIVYGSTEAEPISHVEAETLSEGDWAVAAAGGGLPVGTPVPEVAIRIVDDEVQVAGRHVNEGYIDSAMDADAKIRVRDLVYHRTGDAGRLDGSGRLWLLGRRSASAEGIHPFALETAARMSPGVKGAAFLNHGGRRILFVEGKENSIEEAFAGRIRELGVEVRSIASMPLDRRHRSKPDYAALIAATRD